MASLGEFIPDEQSAPQAPVLGEFIPDEQSFGDFISNEEFVATNTEFVRSKYGDDSAERYQRVASQDPTFPTFEEFRDKWISDEEAQASKGTLDKTVEAIESGVEFGGGLLTGLKRMAKAGADVAINDVPKFIDKTILVNPFDPEQLMERNRVQRKALSIVLEGAARSTAGLGQSIVSASGESADLFRDKEEEIAAEYNRLIFNQNINNAMDKGIIRSAIEKNVSKEAADEFAQGKTFVEYIDPQDKNEQNRLLVAEMAFDPTILATGPAGKALSATRMGSTLAKADKLKRSLARNVAKKGSRLAGEAGGATLKAGGKALDVVGQQIAKRAKQAIPFTIGADAAGFGGIATLKALGALAGGKTAAATGRITKRFGEKAQAISRVIDSPDTHKRFLDRLATENGSTLAGMASKYGGTRLGDALFDAAVDGATVGAINAAEAALAGADARGIGEAAGMGAAAGGAIGGGFGERGAGSSTALVDADGGLTARSVGSFDKVRANKSKALTDLDQSNKFEALPNEVKAAMGQYAEMGVLPDNVILLDPKDYGQLQKSLGRSGDVDAEMTNAAIYLPNESAIVLNSKADFSNGEGLRIMGEELGHNAMTQVIANDPTIVQREAARFHDSKGKAMPLTQGDRVKGNISGDGENVRVNKEMANFVDQYNQAADASGAPRIETFEQALQEWYGAQAGISMGSNKAVISPSAPLWVHKVGLGIRNMQMKALGKSPRNTRSYAKSIDQAANTPMGKYTREQYKAWVRDLEQVQKKSGDILDEVRVPEVKDSVDATNIVDDSPLSTTPAVDMGPVVKPVKGSKATKARHDRGKEIAKLLKRDQLNVKDLATLPDYLVDFYVNSLPKSQQAAARQAINMLKQAKDNGDSVVGIYENIGRKKGEKNFVEFVPTNILYTNAPTNPAAIQFLGRDLLAAKFNINKMLNDGVIKGDPDVIMNEVLQGLEDFSQGKIARLPDRDLVILGEKRPARGQPLQDKVLRQYAEENAPTTARDPEHKRLKETVNQFNLGTLMAISEGKTKASPMQQVPGQEGLMFANPTRVELSPQAMDFLAPQSKSSSIGKESLVRKSGDIQVLDADSKFSPESISRRYLKVLNGSPIGVVQVVSPNGVDATIANAFVLPDHQRTGVASELLLEARGDFDSVSHSDMLSESGSAFARSSQ